MMTTLLQDLLFAFRQLRKTPGFTLLAVLTLALGIGSTTAVFSLVDNVLLRPLPVPQPERLVTIENLSQRHGSSDTSRNPASYPDFFDWREQAKSFDSMASSQFANFALHIGGAPARQVDGLIVSADYFHVLGILPSLGRSFTRAEEQAGNRSVILSHDLWRSSFNSDPAVLGKSIELGDASYVVVGVAAAGLMTPGASDTALWVTPASAMEGANPSGKRRDYLQIDVLARLAPGVSLQQASAELTHIQQALSLQYAKDDKNNSKDVRYTHSVDVRPELEKLVGTVQTPLHILLAAVGMLLLIACANIAGLLLMRTAGRKPELAIRAALGASRMQIVRQLMLESLTLSTLGGAAGIALAAMVLRLAPRYLPPDLPRAATLSLDGRVLAFSIVTSLLTGLLFGVLPAWRMSRLDPSNALRDHTRGNTANRSQNRLHSALIVGETAVGLVLLVGAGLLIRSFHKVLSVDLGFDPQHLLTFRVAVPPKHFTDPQLIQFSQQLQLRLQALPGVEQASYGFPLPISGSDFNLPFSIDGRPADPNDQPTAHFADVAANYFTTMKMPLLRGRFFVPTDDQVRSAPTVVINHAFADRYFPGEDPLGKHISTITSFSDLTTDAAPTSREIVGIVANSTLEARTDAVAPEYFVPISQQVLFPPSFVMRVKGDPATYADTVRRIVAEQDRALPVDRVKTYTQLLRADTAERRFQTLLLTVFSGIALLLAAIGLYGVLGYMVTQRTPELGVRLALGAQRSHILYLMVGRGLALAATGLLLGVGVSLLLTRYLQTLLFATKALDIGTFATMTLLLLCVSTVACMVPAYRASRLDPNETLRQQ